jgi:hypothetical protein
MFTLCTSSQYAADCRGSYCSRIQHSDGTSYLERALGILGNNGSYKVLGLTGSMLMALLATAPTLQIRQACIM